MSKAETKPTTIWETFKTGPRSTIRAKHYPVYDKTQKTQLKIISLIERFYHQIRYGCIASECDTLTCRTHRARKHNGAPFRTPTTITARTISAYLAAMDDPFAHLCKNIPAPSSDPFDIAFPTSNQLYRLLPDRTETKKSGGSDIDKVSRGHVMAEVFSQFELEDWMEMMALSNSKVDLARPYPYKPEIAIDPKSFTQGLFSSRKWNFQPFYERYRRPKVLNPGYNASHNTDFGHSKLDAVFAALKDINQNTEIESLFDDNTDSIPESTDGSSKSGVYICAPINRSELSDVLSTPSRLMLCDLQPHPSPRPDSNTELLKLFPGLQFFQDKVTQPIPILSMEFAMLEEEDTECDLERLASSVKSTHFQPSLKRSMPAPIAAHILGIAMASLSASVFRDGRSLESRSVWDKFQASRSKGLLLHPAESSTIQPASSDRVLTTAWAFAYEEPAAQYLMTLVLRSFASWSYRSNHLPADPSLSIRADKVDMDDSLELKDRLILSMSDDYCPPGLNTFYNLGILEWARTIFLQNWDGESKFQWNSDVGASIDFMNWMYIHRKKLEIEEENFAIEILVSRLDYVDACKEWLEFQVTPSTGNLLDFPWLFNNNAKVTMFRSINLCRMFAAYETSVITNDMYRRMSPYVKPAARPLLDKLSTSKDTFLVLDIRRDNILGDAFNQIWRRQKRELFRPLKVRMGMDEGEEGVDMGGVQQEFFRLAIGEALDPSHGLFNVDSRTRMTWFQPMSTAPLHQFTLIGLLFGLAVYNGITLAITFPLAFYRKLLALQNISLDDIEDGWPDLHTGLDSLLTWTDGNVEDVFLRMYTFSFEAVGAVKDIDMSSISREDKWPTESQGEDGPDVIHGGTATEPEMVTNENRRQYVEDYIYWLTDKSIAPQFEAFATGFYLPLQKKALSLFTPEDLQLLLEGHQSIDIQGLKATTRYEDGYNESHPRMKDFWDIVENLTPDQHKSLLEFVTASPRVPVRGMEEVTFILQRNGEGDERLPTSMTCFGRLLLPEYSSKEIMAGKLRLAIENSTGFGTQ